MRSHVLLGLGLAFAGFESATGFRTKTVDGSEEAMRWSVPNDELSTDGLGAGISWAISQDFGGMLVPLFKENDFHFGFDFVTTESLNDALQRAMFQWASNHKYLTFFNVSDKCTNSDCDVAELYIHAMKGGEKYDYVPVKVFQTFNSSSGATVRTTAGRTLDAKAIIKSEIIFFIDHPVEQPDFRRGLHCFYLDETFCEPFQNMQLTFDFKLMIEVICFTLWGISFLMALKRAIEYIIGYSQKGYHGVKMIARVHVSHILYSYYMMLMMIFPPALYWVAVYPCFLCYSFESLCVSAIGQVLGFEYVDAPDSKNQVVSQRMGAKTCAAPQDYVKEGNIDMHSVLMTPSPYVADYCLTNSDLDGLYTLYPLCTGANTTPKCLRSKTNLGYLRVGLAFGVPFGLISVIIFTTVAVLRRVERKASEDVKKRLAVNAFSMSASAPPARRKSLGSRAMSTFGGMKLGGSRRASKAGALGATNAPAGESPRQSGVAV